MPMKTLYAVTVLFSLFMSSILQAQICVRDYNFSTPGDIENWSSIKFEPGTLGQATSNGVGVLQARMLSAGTAGDVDMQLFANPGSATLPISSAWEKVSFRVRQLNDNGAGAPGTPQNFDYASTIMLLSHGGNTINAGGFNNAYWTNTTQDADGWIEFSFDLAQYLSDNSMTNAAITYVRLDVIGNPANYGNWVQIDYCRLLATVPRTTEPVFAEYTFETAGVTDGWSVNNPEAGTFAQAAASSGEGVLQVRQQTNGTEDVQLYANPGTLSIGSKRSWDTFEFRIRQLKDDGTGQPGAPRSFHSGGTILLITGYNGGAINFSAIGNSPYWWRQPADTNGWSVFTFDFAQYLSDNGLSENADFTQIRLDPSGSSTLTVGDWSQIDYFRLTATPQPPPSETIFMLQ